MIEPALATSTPAPEEDVTTRLYRAAIGPVSNGYYLPIFTRFEAADHAGITWNTSAALFTLNWLAFRRLWGPALAYAGALVAIVLLVFGIGRLVFLVPDTLVGALALGFGLAAFVLPGLFGNAVFHTDCRKRMSKALAAHSDVSDACAQLEGQASTRKRAIILAAVNALLLIVAVLAYLQWSAWSNLTVMPTGALEAGHVAVGRTVDMTTAASAPAAIPASAAASSTSAPASAPASEPAAPLATTMAMVDTVKQEAAKPVSLPTPAKNAKPAEVEKPKMTEPKAQPVKAEKPAKPEKVTKPYFVNVGLFAVPENAERAHARLLDARLPSVLTELKSAKGQQIRVRVGPFASKQDAKNAVEKIKALKLDAVMVQH
jgi:cell division septation protein DedD